MSDFNPYAPSQVQHQHVQADPGESVEISLGAMDALKKTRPWVQITSIMLFLLAGFAVLKLLHAYSMMSEYNTRPGYKVGMFIGVSVVVTIYIVLGLKLLNYKKAISSLAYTNNPADFEKAMDVHSSYWKFVSILMIIFLSLFIVAAILG